MKSLPQTLRSELINFSFTAKLHFDVDECISVCWLQQVLIFSAGIVDFDYQNLKDAFNILVTGNQEDSDGIGGHHRSIEVN